MSGSCRSGAALLLAIAVAPSLDAQTPGSDYADASGAAIYQAACANCHGADGTGLDPAQVAFEEPLPDFTDCAFASREPDADWIAVAHEGGPVRGFSQMMPAFGGVLTPEQLQRVMDHIRTLCTDDAWPRGELNLPRAIATEKAFPEDEWVIEASAALDEETDIAAAFVYERRFGARSQLEFVLPYGVRQVTEGDVSREAWGLGDVTLGVKHAFDHSYEAGRILALIGEVKLPTGDEDEGLGAGSLVFEGFLSYGQILPSDAFLQGQFGAEVLTGEESEVEGIARLVLGRTWTEGPWGRAWSPMVELLAVRPFEDGASTVLDVVPQFQVALNTRQHVLANLGVQLPLTETEGRSPRLVAYVLLDWFDGGFFEGW